MGWLAVFASIVSLGTGLNGGLGGIIFGLGPAFICTLVALFFFGISALGSAIFDIADAAVRRHAMDKHREAKEAYQAYQASQDLG